MRTLMLCAIFATLLGVACAQSGGNYDLSWWTIDGGGVTFATGGTFNLGGTIGQPDASSALTGGTYSLTGGFWFTPACIPTNGDVDGSGCVDDADLLNVLFAFGATGANPADVNCDNTVDDADLLIVLFNFGSGC
ncbi:MAG: hypothetical protein K6U12_06140 [Armatimonadetes bacterium]|nr:hypothetical protein [Armatimonadota bacterium]CUU34769.1 hypothetical protein DCOP10_1113 [Armatimonadetes bacterium DC]